MRVQKRSGGGGDGQNMHNLQGRAKRIMLVWFIEEKTAVRDRAVDLERKGCIKSIKPHLFFMASVGEWADGSYPPSQGPERHTLASLHQTEVGNLLRSPSHALP